MSYPQRSQESFSLYKWLLLVFVVFTIGVLVLYFRSVDGLIDPNGEEMLGRDFVNFWMGGHSVWTGKTAALFDRSVYSQLLTARFETLSTSYAFSYPPHVLFLLAPFGALPYLPALIAWTFGGVAAFYFSARSLFLSKTAQLLLIFAPTTLICILSGQTGLFAAALFVAGCRLKDKHPFVAGILFGLLTVKPQMGVLLALVLLLTKSWRVIISALVTTSVMILASIIAFGVMPWTQFIFDVAPHQSAIIASSYGIFDHMVPSLFKFCINIGLGKEMAWVFQALLMLICALLIIWAHLRKAPRNLRLALLFTLTGLFSPYMGVYDLPLLTVAVLLLVPYLSLFSVFIRGMILGLILISPFATVLSSLIYGFPLGFVSMVGVAGLIIWAIVETPVRAETG